MAKLAPDVALALEMLAKWDVKQWERLVDGVSQPYPRITDGGGESLEAFLAWAGGNAAFPRSHVEAAVCNTARVAADLNGVFGYDAELKTGYTVARAWYRDAPAGVKREEAVADWEVHLLLIRNLAVELIRSVNLVVQRVERADPASLPNRSLAVIEIDGDHALVEAVSYSASEAKPPQPYPGLGGFPAVIEGRSPGTLGHRRDGTPREPAEFERWIRTVEGETRVRPAPPQAKLPFCLGPSKQKSVAGAPSRWTVLIGVLTAAGLAVTFAPAPAWFTAAAVGAALAASALHREVWPRPSARGVLAVAVAIAGCGLGAYLLFETGSDRSPRPEAAAEGQSGHGVGQIEGGNIVRASAEGASGTYLDPLDVNVDSTATVAIRLSNVGPDEIFGTRVSARLPGAAASSLSIELVAHLRNGNPPTVADTATVEVGGGKSGCVAYIPGSARLYDRNFGLIRELPDDIVGAGVTVGPLGVALDRVRFVGFEVELVDSAEDGCG